MPTPCGIENRNCCRSRPPHRDATAGPRLTGSGRLGHRRRSDWGAAWIVMHRRLSRAALAVMIGLIAGPACAQLPMSPVYRSGPNKPEPTKPSAAAAPTKAAEPNADGPIVATAPVPPPAPPAADLKPPPAAAKKAAVASAAKRHAPPRHYASYPRYRTAYQAAGARPAA